MDLLHSPSRDISGMNDLFRVSIEGGTPMQSAPTATQPSTSLRLRRTGKACAFTARGNASGQWWRKGHSHLDECEIWLMRDTSATNYEQITESGGKNMWPMWSGGWREHLFRFGSERRAEYLDASVKGSVLS